MGFPHLLVTILGGAFQLLLEPLVYLFFDEDQPVVSRMAVLAGFVLFMFLLWRTF